MAYEEGNLLVRIEQKAQIVNFEPDSSGLLEALINGKVPESTQTGTYELEPVRGLSQGWHDTLFMHNCLNSQVM